MSENSSQAVNSSGQGLTAMQNSLRVAITTTLVQVLVWPFIGINLFMFFVFRQREALRSEPRYLLFSQTLLADAFFLLFTNFVVLTIQGKLLLPLVLCLPLCMVMEGLSHLSPAIIVAMCLERYVAVCLPLHHVDIFSPHRTKLFTAIVWLISFLKPLVDFSIFLSHVSESYFTQLTFCYYEIMLLKDWHIAMRGNLYILSYLVVLVILLFCYASVIVAARRASGDDRKSASKGQRTLLLHLLQLFLCTLESICPYIEAQILLSGDLHVYVVVRSFDFLAFSILSRAASPIIYGLRDEKFYAAFRYYARCTMNQAAPEK